MVKMAHEGDTGDPGLIDELSDYAEYISSGSINYLINKLAEKLGSKRKAYEYIGVSRGTLYSGYKMSFETKKKVIIASFAELGTDDVVKVMIDDVLFTLNMLVLDYVKYLKSRGEQEKVTEIYEYVKDFIDDRTKSQIGEIEPKVTENERGDDCVKDEASEKIPPKNDTGQSAYSLQFLLTLKWVGDIRVNGRNSTLPCSP